MAGDFIDSSGTSAGAKSSGGGFDPSSWTAAFTSLFGSGGSQSQSGTQRQTGTVSDVGTTDTTQTQVSPEALSLIAQIFPQLFTQATGGDYSKAAAIKDSQGVVNQVMQQLKEQVLPQIYTGESSRGGYSSTAKALLTNDAAARAAGQAASLVGDIATKYGGVAATQQNALINLVNAAVNASKMGTTVGTTTGTKTSDLTQTTDTTADTSTEGLFKHIFGW